MPLRLVKLNGELAVKPPKIKHRFKPKKMSRTRRAELLRKEFEKGLKRHQQNETRRVNRRRLYISRDIEAFSHKGDPPAWAVRIEITGTAPPGWVQKGQHVGQGQDWWNRPSAKTMEYICALYRGDIKEGKIAVLGSRVTPPKGSDFHKLSENERREREKSGIGVSMLNVQNGLYGIFQTVAETKDESHMQTEKMWDYVLRVFMVASVVMDQEINIPAETPDESCAAVGLGEPQLERLALRLSTTRFWRSDEKVSHDGMKKLISSKILPTYNRGLTLDPGKYHSFDPRNWSKTPDQGTDRSWFFDRLGLFDGLEAQIGGFSNRHEIAT